MQVYRFRSLKDVHVTAFAASPVGRDLPDDLAPWHYQEPVEVPEGPSNAELLQSIRREGYFLMGAKQSRP